MSAHKFALLCAAGSGAFGIARYFSGLGPWWQMPLMALVGFSAIYVLGLIVWVYIDPSDAVGVARHLWRRVTRKV